MYPDITTLKQIVIQAAEQELLPRFRRVEFECKTDGSMVTEADVAMQQAVQERLRERWPQYEVLGEEMSESEQRQKLQNATEGLWIFDPLDGTSNFAAGLPFFSVSLALLIKGRPVIGLIYDPVRRECFHAEQGKGAWLDDQALVKRALRHHLKQCLAVVDFKRLAPPLARRLAETPPYGSQRSLGSAALEWCWLAANRFHLYLHGKQKLWDYAAGALILEETGGHSSTLTGEPVFIADVAPRSALAALDERLFEQWQQWLRVEP